MDNKYQNGKIYKLVCDNTPIVYYGSTISSLEHRLNEHRRSNCCSSLELFQLGNVSIELVEEYPCNSRKELQARERIYIEFMLKNFNHKIICNKYIPGRTRAEWRIDNRDSIKDYYKANRDVINKKQKEYYKANRDTLKERSREYHKANREKKNEHSKVYHKENRETINKKQREKFDCECGGRYTRSGKARHMKTKKHLAYVSANSNNTE